MILTTDIKLIFSKIMQASAKSIFGLGLMILVWVYFNSLSGKYYNGRKLAFYVGVLQEKPRDINLHKQKDYIHLQLSYEKSKFIIIDNGYSIVRYDFEKMTAIRSLNKGDTITIEYSKNDKNYINKPESKIKVISMKSKKGNILSSEELLKADNFDKTMYYIIGWGVIFFGILNIFLRKRVYNNLLNKRRQ